MNIEEEIFKKSKFNINKLIKYGFTKNKDLYMYEETFLNNEFKAVIEVNSKGKVNGKVIELINNEEYTNIRTEMTGIFINKVRDSYIELLKELRDNCFDTNAFLYEQTNRINEYIKDKYKCNPEFLWDKYPGFAIYRNKNNNKWFSIIGNVKRSTVIKESTSDEIIELINVKVDENNLDKLLLNTGYYEAYHMNKKNWISIILDNTLKDEEIYKLIDNSYSIIDEPSEWIIPANPKYYDIVNAFNETDEIIWKQSTNIEVNDIIYLYVAEPFSKIMYKCRVIDANIPYEYKDKNVSMNKVMKIKLLKKLDDKNYTFNYLNSLGIKAIRGPRKVSKDITNNLK